MAFFESLGLIEYFRIGPMCYSNCNFLRKEAIKNKVSPTFRRSAQKKINNNTRDCTLYMNNLVLTLFHFIKIYIDQHPPPSPTDVSKVLQLCPNFEQKHLLCVWTVSARRMIFAVFMYSLWFKSEIVCFRICCISAAGNKHQFKPK